MKGLKELKRLIIILILAILVIVGMTYWVYPHYHLARINTEILPRLETLTMGINEAISPNGNWELDITKKRNPNGEIEKETITFTSIDIPFIKYSFSFPGDFRYSDYFPGAMPWVAISWSPDGKSIFFIRFTNRWCVDQQIVMFEEKNGKWDSPYYFQKTEIIEEGVCSYFAWSKDGTQLAMHSRTPTNNGSDDLNITILNKKAEVVRNFLVNTPDNGFGFDFLYWKGTEFLLVNADALAQNNQDNSERLQRATTIYRFSSIEPEKVTHVIDLPRFYQLFGKDPKSNHILLAAFDYISSCAYVVINTDKRIVEENTSLEGACGNSARLVENEVIAFYYYNEPLNKSIAEFWDWTTMTFNEKGVYQSLEILPWQDNLRGFLILRENSNGKKYFDVLRP